MHSYMALGRIAAHDAPVEGMLVVPEAGYLVSCSTDRTVRVWDYGAGEELKTWRHPEEFRCVAHKRSTGHIVAGTDQHSIVSFPLFEVMAEQKALKEKLAREERERLERAAAEAAAAAEEARRIVPEEPSSGSDEVPEQRLWHLLRAGKSRNCMRVNTSWEEWTGMVLRECYKRQEAETSTRRTR